MTPEKRIEALRKIVSTRTARKIDGVLVDLFSASLIVRLYDALNEKNKAKYAGYDAGVMGGIAYDAVREGMVKVG